MGSVVYSYTVQAFSDVSLNYLDIFNEVTIMIIAYLTIPYPDYLIDPYFKY